MLIISLFIGCGSQSARGKQAPVAEWEHQQVRERVQSWGGDHHKLSGIISKLTVDQYAEIEPWLLSSFAWHRDWSKVDPESKRDSLDFQDAVVSGVRGRGAEGVFRSQQDIDDLPSVERFFGDRDINPGVDVFELHLTPWHMLSADLRELKTIATALVGRCLNRPGLEKEHFGRPLAVGDIREIPGCGLVRRSRREGIVWYENGLVTSTSFPTLTNPYCVQFCD